MQDWARRDLHVLAAHILMDCQLYSANTEAMINVIELSFVRHNTPYLERSLNLSSLL